MNQHQVRSFLERYFTAYQARYEENHPAYFRVELPAEVDKDLGNRPFYWTYVERLNLEPQLLSVTFIFDSAAVPPDTQGEEVMFGSPRLLQFFASSQRQGRYIRLYEQTAAEPASGMNRGLSPWLGINCKVSFICDRKKDILLSLGFNLIHGSIIDRFFERMEAKPLSPVMPDYAYTIRPIFSIDSAVERLERHIHHLIDQEDKSWAKDAEERLNFELSLVESFYSEEGQEEEENKGEREDRKKKRMEELRWQYEPRIEINIVNGGIFFLDSSQTQIE
ncbi:YqhG family protein [Aneurinibacillus tyrosinisolvens]|jgi:hypothetical protein|uniref:YqhG family protein n=1 Tax=Aneurinibacillus tyrosinisolvens TaxID=1443435 RepID=UPI00063F404E|nr:YqhG family protein [Aneurinibacillus tyrosinisolvens]